MKTLTQMKIWFLGAAIILAGFAGSAQADPDKVDIHVSISASKSLQALTTYYYFGGLDINTSSHSATAIVVRNNSGAIIETYKLVAGNAIADGVGTDWTLDPVTPSPDHYVLSAQFGTNRPADTADGTWGSDNLDTSAAECSDVVFGNGTLNQSGKSVSPDSTGNVYDRNLWFRIKTPTMVTDGGAHTAQVTLSVK